MTGTNDERVLQGISQRLDATTALRTARGFEATDRGRRLSGFGAVIAVGVVALVAGFGHLAATAGSDPRAAACPADPRPDLAFSLDRASDIWSHLPNCGAAPELQIDQPAYVAVYTRPVHVKFTGNPKGGTTLGGPVTNLVCVVVNGSPNYYPGADLTGAKG